MPAEYPRAAWREAHPKNYSNRPPGVKPSWIVLHATATGPGTGPATVAYFARENARRVSAHYVVFKTGEVVQCVKEAHRAHHAGASRYRGLTRFNDFSIGIEMVNLNDGQDPYPDEQVVAVRDLVWYLMDKYGITPDRVATHTQVSTAGKTDPRGFPLARVLAEIDQVANAARETAWAARGVPLNRSAALLREARERGLGAPQTREISMVVSGTEYVVQGFALGVAFCRAGDWQNVRVVDWLGGNGGAEA